jgi:hypothetical protein
MAPFVNLGVDVSRCDPVRMLRDDDRGAALFHLFDDPVHVKRLVGEQGVKTSPLDKGGDTDGVVALAGQQFEVDHIAKRIRQREDLACNTATRATYGLALSPPFAPCPWRWTLQIVPSLARQSMRSIGERGSWRIPCRDRLMLHRKSV